MDGFGQAILHFNSDGLERDPERLRGLLLDSTTGRGGAIRPEVNAIVSAYELGIASSPPDTWHTIRHRLESEVGVDPDVADRALTIWADALGVDYQASPEARAPRRTWVLVGIAAISVLAIAVVLILVRRDSTPLVSLPNLYQGDCITTIERGEDSVYGSDTVLANVVACSQSHQYEYVGYVGRPSQYGDYRDDFHYEFCEAAVEKAAPAGFVPDVHYYGCFARAQTTTEVTGAHLQFTQADQLAPGDCLVAVPSISGKQVVTTDCSDGPSFKFSRIIEDYDDKENYDDCTDFFWAGYNPDRGVCLELTE